MRKQLLLTLVLLLVLSVSLTANSTTGNMAHKAMTFETDHFKVHYPKRLSKTAQEVAAICENLYGIYRNKYGITLPKKTEVLVTDKEFASFALTIQNLMSIEVGNIDFNLRGTGNWLEGVVAHEYAHIASISASFKMPYWMPYIQAGGFSHPNEKRQLNAMYIYPSEVLPPWFFEGIAQYESVQQKGDTWDTHRDMILRTLVLTDSMLTWDHMSVFNGRGDDYEKTYNHGFALVKYIAETYGEDKIVAIIKESSRFGRLTFDNSIKSVLGISGRTLYAEWKEHLRKKYGAVQNALGTVTEAKKISPAGWNCGEPRFSNDDSMVFYLSNGANATFGRMLNAYSLSDTIEEDEDRNKVIAPYVNSAYDIHNDTIFYASRKSPSSKLAFREGGERVSDLYAYPMPDFNAKKPSYKKRLETQLTKKMNISNPQLSPDGSRIAGTLKRDDTTWVVLFNRKDSVTEKLYPSNAKGSEKITSIFGIRWSNDGKKLVIDYFDRFNRKIGYYDFDTNAFYTVANNGHDNRTPNFNKTGDKIYFSSDKSGIYNIYCYDIKSGKTSQVTNVLGGAFSPAVSSDESKLTYTAYTSDGYKIFLLDSLQNKQQKTTFTVNSSELEKKLFTLEDLSDGKVERSGYTPQNVDIGGISHRYRRFPNKLMFIPTFISEEILTQKNNTYKGEPIFKKGAILGMMDAQYWLGKGNSMTLFLLSESYIDILKNGKNRAANWQIARDYGLFLQSQALPLDLSFAFIKRNIPTTSDYIQNMEGYDALSTSKVSIEPMLTQLKLDIPLPTNKLKMSYFTSYLKQKAHFNLDTVTNFYLHLDVGDIYRNGVILSMKQKPYTQKSSISPYGSAFKFQYDFNHGRFVDEERILNIKDGKIKSNLHSYNYHLFSGSYKKAKQSLLVQHFDTEVNFGATYLHVPQKTQDEIDELAGKATNTATYSGGLPSFFQPAMMVPGYSYTYRADSSKTPIYGADGELLDSVQLPNDSLVAAGNILLQGAISYRVPLWPKESIDKKLGFIYFDKLYGAVNFGGALAADSFKKLKKMNHEDILFHVGAEVRLKTIAFNSFPLALSFRWDRGLDMPKPAGGNKYTFMIGFAFDNWDIISEPDGVSSAEIPFQNLKKLRK